MIYSMTSSELIMNGEDARKNFPILKEAGFKAIDFSFDTIFNRTGGTAYGRNGMPWCKSELYDLPDEEFFAHFKEIKEASEQNGIAFGQCHAPFPSYVFGGGDELNEYIVYTIKRSIAVAGLLNCPYIIIHPIIAPYGSLYTKSEIFDMNIEFYSQFIDDLKKHGVVACLENMWIQHNSKIYEGTCNDYEEVNRHIDILNQKSGGEYFAFCLDTGHAVITSANIRYAVRTLGKNLKTVHLHEVDGRSDNHTMPFTLGEVDWDMIMTELKANGYEGTLNFEAMNSWRMFPKPLWPQAIKMLGSIGQYFVDTYFG